MLKKVTLGLVATSLIGAVAFAGAPAERPVEKDVKENKEVIENKGVKGSEQLRQELNRLVPVKEVKAIGTGSVESKGAEKASTDVLGKQSTETIIKKSAAESMKDVVSKEKLSKEEAIAKLYGKENAEAIRDLSPENKDIAERVAVAARKKVKSEDGITSATANKLVDIAVKSPKVLGGENAMGEKGPEQCLAIDANAVTNYADASHAGLLETLAKDSGKADVNADRYLMTEGKVLAEKIGLKEAKEGMERVCALTSSCPGLNGKPIVSACARRGM